MIEFIAIANNPVLSNNNQTITCNLGEGTAKLNKSINKNKQYIEINLSKMGIAPYIGIMNEDNYVFTNYPPYHNTSDIITTQWNGSPSDTKTIPNIGILSILIDCINKHIKVLYNNSTILIDKDFAFNNINIIMGSGDSSGGGGATFTIINKENLNYSIPQGYRYYNINDKYLIKQADKYYSIKPEFYDEERDQYSPILLQNPTVDDFNNHGDLDLSTIKFNALNKILSNNKYNIAMLK